MANFEKQKIELDKINGNQKFQNGDIPEEIAFNAPIEASAYAQDLAEQAITKAEQALNYALGGGASNLPLLSAYPIGSIYISTNETEPAQLFGGTWEKIKDTFLLASGDTYANGSEGGSANSVLVSHTHSMTYSANATLGNHNAYIPMVNSSSPASFTASATMSVEGEDGTGKNMPPYLVVNVWVRIA